MRALVAISIFVLNTLNTTLYNVTIVGDKEDVRIGKLRSGWKKPLKIESDSIEVVFTLTPNEDEWFATDKMPIGNVILTDSTKTYEVILVEEKEIR
jgi:hypothetical protein